MSKQLHTNILQAYLKEYSPFRSDNKTLLISTENDDSFLDIYTLDFSNQANAFTLIDQLIAHKPTITIGEQAHSDEQPSTHPLWEQLTRIAQTEHLIKTETGTEELYIGYPMIRGTFADGTSVASPLLLFPVSLQKKHHSTGIIWQITRRDEPINFNRLLLQGYAKHNQIRIFDNFLEYSFDEFPRNSEAFHAQLFELLRVSPLNIAIDFAQFNNTLVALNTSMLQENEMMATLQLVPEAVLGLVPQASSFHSTDDEFIANHFVGERADDAYFFKPFQKRAKQALVKEEQQILPFEIDHSQEIIYKEVKAGNSLVVQGPPGTGKTQLICNLIADFTARGKKVLVISEKRNALDNIANRLATIGMDAFATTIHDFKNDRKRIYKALADQLEASHNYQTYNAESNQTAIEHAFLERSQLITTIVSQLDNFQKALSDDTIAGISIQELYHNTSQNIPVVDLQDCYQALRLNELTPFWSKLEEYLDYQAAIYTTHPDEEPDEAAQFWNYRPLYHQVNKADISTIAEAIEEVHNFALQLDEHIPEISSVQQLEAIEEENNSFQILFDTLVNERVYKMLCRNLQERLHSSDEEMFELENEVKACFEGQGIEITLPAQELKPFLKQLNEAITAKSKTLGGIVWGLFGAGKNTIQEVTAGNGLGTSLSDLLKLQERIKNRITLEDWWINWSYLFEVNAGTTSNDSESPWLRKGYRWFERKFQEFRQATRAEDAWKNIHSIPLTTWRDIPWNRFHKKLTGLQTINEQWLKNKGVWQSCLSNWQLNYLMQTPEIDLVSVTTFLITKFDLLQEADQLRSTFSKEELTTIERSLDFSNLNKVPEIIVNSLNNAWINDIEEQHPVLQLAGTPQIDRLEEELQISLREKQHLSQDILLILLRDYCIKQLASYPEVYRELKHQVAKKRKIWSMRQLFHEFRNEIFSLIPCWLASPTTISAIFPITGKQDQPLVDLVIVDEASQCDVYASMPALLRGTQLVIIGDTQQLAPNPISNPALPSQYSLLDWASGYLPSYSLTKHYRSKSVALINFSNTHFYHNSLQALPHAKQIYTDDIAINYFNVGGNYDEGVNEIEASMVRSLINQIRNNNPEKSIGVITFTTQQQQYLQELLEKDLTQKSKKQSEEEAPIYIKTVDFVQGDEYDITIISLTYAQQGSQLLSTQLETLTPAHVNVASTRAKEHCYVVCSISPEELAQLDTQEEGVHLLHEYLLYLLDEHQALDYTLTFPQLEGASETEAYTLVLNDNIHHLSEVSSKQNYGYFPTELAKRGWNIHYQYSREHWLN